MLPLQQTAASPYPKQYKGNSMIAGETAMKILMRWGRVWSDWDSHDNSTL